MEAVGAAGAAFLIAVLWFDLMFDVQVRGHRSEVLPDNILASIAAYYRRVTTEASPMGSLVSLVMIITVLAIGVEIYRGLMLWVTLPSLALSIFAMGLAGVRIVPNAVRLGHASDTPAIQSRLARSIYREHVYCIVAMTTVLALQISAAVGLFQ